MRTHVLLDIVPDQIHPEDWAEAYDTTLQLLRAHPARLMGFDWVMVQSTRVPAFTRSIERYVDTPVTRHWGVSGDRASLRTGECPILYRDVRNYRRGGTRIRIVNDILEHAADERHRDTGGPSSVFGEDTRGEPYSLAILAAAMIIESRFPLHAMVWGDIDRPRAEAAQHLVQRLLQMHVALPVRADVARLTDRLRGFLSGDALVRAVERLCLDRPGRHLPAWKEAEAPAAPPPIDDIEDLAAAPSADALSPRRRDDLLALTLGVRRVTARILSRDTPEPSSRDSPTLAAALRSGDAALLRRALMEALSRRGPILSEDAWDHLSREEDTATLELLLVLAAVYTGSPDFVHLQRAAFENPALCRFMVDAARDESFMDSMADKIHALWPDIR